MGGRQHCAMHVQERWAANAGPAAMRMLVSGSAMQGRRAEAASHCIHGALEWCIHAFPPIVPLQHHAGDAGAHRVANVMSAEDYNTFAARARASPLFVLPLAKGPGSFVTLLLQVGAGAWAGTVVEAGACRCVHVRAACVSAQCRC